MPSDYSITIFSRHKGKTRTFNLNRRVVYLPLAMLLVLVVACAFFVQAYFQEREESQRLEGRIVLLEKLMGRLEERSARQGGENPEQAMADTAAGSPAQVASVKERAEASSGAGEAQSQIGSEAQGDGQPVAQIDDVKAAPRAEDREGFELSFKLINLVGEPIAGNVAIVSSLRPPYQPRFISFPSMRLKDGMPVKLRKSVGFSIKYFKYVNGKFAFPFSHAESFRILIYDQEEHLILDATVQAEDVAVKEIVNEEAAPPASPPESSLSS
ncbi:MAG: hypothetical protein P8075_08735 [Deltaproteobacteria bacterium]